MKNKVINNAFWIIGCRIVQAVLSLIITMMTARFLGPSDYGLINYASAIVIFVTPIVQLGLGSILVKELVDYPNEEGKIIGTSLILSLISALLSYICIFVFVCCVNSDENVTMIICSLYSIQLFFQGAELMQYWFQSKYLSKYASVVSLIVFGVVSLYKGAIIFIGKSVVWFAISNSIDFVLIEVSLLMIYRKLNGQKLRVSYEVAKRMLSSSKHYILSNMMIVVFTQTDRIMLKNMLGDVETGYYSAATTCACMVNFVFSAIIDSARPSILFSYNEDKNKFQKKVSLLYSVIIFLSVAFGLFITVFAGVIIDILYGSNFAPAIIPLRIFVWTITFSYIGTIRNIWILAESKQKWMWIINLSGCIANVVLNIIFINLLGMWGAAIASVLSQGIANVLISYFIVDIRANMKLMINGLNPKYVKEYILELKSRNFKNK